MWRWRWLRLNRLGVASFSPNPPCPCARVFSKGLFYFFFAIAVVYLPTIPVILSSESFGEEYSILLVSFIGGFVFYLGLALLFRRAAR